VSVTVCAINVSACTGACTTDAHPLCLVTEFCERGSLSDLMRRTTRFDLSFQVHVAAEVCAGLRNLHAHSPSPILHHDVKCSNILITNDFTIKLADFGLSRVQAVYRNARVAQQLSASVMRTSLTAGVQIE
jgi:serine/threonine protein kinase